MLKEQAREAIIREWLALPRQERRSDLQAGWFAMKIKDRYPFKADGDRYQVIKGFLVNYLDRP
jgi:hypothetical protein